jgi:hypothetical protein
VYHVQRTEFLPSAYLLIQSIVVIIITALAFTEIEPTYEAVIILAFISFFFVALLRLLRIMDRPFHVEEHTQDDVSLFLLRRFVERPGSLARLTAAAGRSPLGDRPGEVAHRDDPHDRVAIHHWQVPEAPEQHPIECLGHGGVGPDRLGLPGHPLGDR